MMPLPVPVQHVAAPELAGQVTAFNPCTHSCCQPTNYLMIPVFPPPPPPYPHNAPTTSTTTNGSNGETEKTLCQKQTVHDDSSGGAGFSRHVFKSKRSSRSSPTVVSNTRQNLEYISQRNATLNEPHQPGVRRDYKRSRALTDKWQALQRRANEQVQRNKQTPKKTLTIPFDPRKWTPKDVHTWLFYTTNMHDIDDVDFSFFVMNGQGLCVLKESNFLYRVPNPGAKILFRDLRLRLWKCLKTEKALKNGYRIHGSDTGSNHGHGVSQAQQEQFQRPLNFSTPRSVSNLHGASNSHGTSNLPEPDRRELPRHVVYSTARQHFQSPLNVIGSPSAMSPSGLNHRAVPRHVAPPTDKQHFQSPLNFSNPRGVPHSSESDQRESIRHVRHLTVPQEHLQGPLNFTVSPKPSESDQRESPRYVPRPTEIPQQRFQGPLNFIVPPNPPKPDQRENLRYIWHPTDTPQQRFPGPLNFAVSPKLSKPESPRYVPHTPEKPQQRFQGPLNFTVPPNATKSDQRESLQHIPRPTDRPQQRLQGPINFTVPPNPSSPNRSENPRHVAQDVDHNKRHFQSPLNFSRTQGTSNPSGSEVRENIPHIVHPTDRHQFKRPAKNHSFDRHTGRRRSTKLPLGQTPWDYHLRQVLANGGGHLQSQKGNLPQSKHGSRNSTSPSEPEPRIEHTRKSPEKSRKISKRPVTADQRQGPVNYSADKPTFQRSDSCPISNVSPDPRCTDQSEDGLTSDNETNQEQLSQETSVVTFHRSNSYPETTGPYKNDELDVSTLQRSGSSPEVTSPRHVDQRVVEHDFQHSDSSPKESTNSFDEFSSSSMSVSTSPEHLREDKLMSGSSPGTNSGVIVKTETKPTLSHNDDYIMNSEPGPSHGHVDMPVAPDPGQVDLPVKVKIEPDDELDFSQGSSCSVVEKQSGKMETEPFVCKLENHNEYLPAADDKKV